MPPLRSIISMANTLFRSHSSPPLSLTIPSYSYPVPTAVYDVFINHRGKDTKQFIASLIYHNLQNKGFKVFLDQKSVQGGDYIPGAIRYSIRRASVHVAIFSPNYADSEWCLDELYLMLRTGAPIVPVFWEIRPSQLRMEDDNGVYARAFQKHNEAGKFDIRTLEKWRKALRTVSHLEGFIYQGDQGEMLEKIAICVANKSGKIKCQPKLLERPLKMRRFLDFIVL